MTTHELPAPVLARSNPFADLARGFAFPFRAMRLIVSNPTLRRLSAITAAISAVLLLLLFGLLVAYTDDILGLVWVKPSGWWLVLWYPVAFLVFAVLFVVGASTVPTLATAPMLDPLSVATERALGIEGDDAFDLARVIKETLHSMAKTAMRLLLFYVGQAFLLLLWLLPVVGHAAWSVAAVLWTVFWLAYEYLDVPANRYGFGFDAVLGFVRKHFFLAMGLGAAIHLILWVPLLNAVFIPVGAVGATMAFVELRRAEVAARKLPASRDLGETSAL